MKKKRKASQSEPSRKIYNKLFSPQNGYSFEKGLYNKLSDNDTRIPLTFKLFKHPRAKAFLEELYRIKIEKRKNSKFGFDEVIIRIPERATQKDVMDIWGKNIEPELRKIYKHRPKLVKELQNFDRDNDAVERFLQGESFPQIYKHSLKGDMKFDDDESAKQAVHRFKKYLLGILKRFRALDNPAR